MTADVNPVRPTIQLVDSTGANTAAVNAGGELSVTDAAVLAKLSADPATQTTLEAIRVLEAAARAVTVAALPLPSGAATSALQGAGLPGALGTNGGVKVDQPTGAAWAVSQPGLSGGILQSVTTVGATAVPLPATPLAGRATMLVQASPTNTANIYLGWLYRHRRHGGDRRHHALAGPEHPDQPFGCRDPVCPLYGCGPARVHL